MHNLGALAGSSDQYGLLVHTVMYKKYEISQRRKSNFLYQIWHIKKITSEARKYHVQKEHA